MNGKLTLYCHVSGHLHELKARFFSSPLTIEIDGKGYAVGACRGCNTPEAVREAYLRFLRGMEPPGRLEDQS